VYGEVGSTVDAGGGGYVGMCVFDCLQKVRYL
jgi:hypothetical protein